MNRFKTWDVVAMAGFLTVVVIPGAKELLGGDMGIYIDDPQSHFLQEAEEEMKASIKLHQPLVLTEQEAIAVHEALASQRTLIQELSTAVFQEGF